MVRRRLNTEISLSLCLIVGVQVFEIKELRRVVLAVEALGLHVEPGLRVLLDKDLLAPRTTDSA